MPPKKKAPEPSKKTEQKKKEKIIEDKTFGLKNKKGAKNQKFIQQVEKQVKFGNQSSKKLAEQAQKTAKKDDKKKDELKDIFRPAIPTQKIDKGADPKSVLCAFYKQGQCTKGDKCKFSHDLTIERKSEKKNIYVDIRDDSDTMDKWDDAKLKEVVEKKHGEAEKKLPKTDKICKYFLDALENSKYGWFWECPNGGDKCHYRHALPPGFVLKKDKKKDEKKDEISIEDLVETQRAALGTNLTKITLETFMKWKKQKLKEKEDSKKKEADRKAAEFKAGRNMGLSGREMFTFRPEMAGEDTMEEGEAAFDYKATNGYEEDGEEEVIVPCKELTLEALSAQAQEVDGSGTIADSRHWQHQQDMAKDGETPVAIGGDAEVDIDENLFDEDDPELEELEEHFELLTT